MNPARWLIDTAAIAMAGVWQGVRQDLNLLEIAAVAVGLYLWRTNSRVSKNKGWRPKGIPAIRAFRRPGLAAVAIIMGAVALRLALIPVLPVPIPIVNDEFSHLLLADTLVHGRVSNPTHLFWRHFESINILQQPRYVSIYFPGHAVMLAAGRIALASPWAGVVAECALFLAALYWALRGWMPPRWALFGMAVAALRFGVASYWINAYHGGFLAAIGGALVFGTYPRFRSSGLRSPGFRFPGPGKDASVARSPVRDVVLGLIFGFGLAILASTRPFEGMLFAAPFALVLAWEMRSQIGRLLRVALAASLVALPAAAALGVYFQHITGSPFVTAYQINQKTYGWPMGLALTAPPKIHNRDIEMQRYYEFEVEEHAQVGSLGGFVESLTFRLQEYWRFFFGPVLTIPLLMLGRVWKRRPMLLAGAAGGIAAILLEGAASPHYLAPATAVLIAVVAEGCRYFDGLRVRLAPLLVAAMAVVLMLRIGLDQAGLPYTQKLNYQSWCCRVKGNLNKARITAELEGTPGNHLLFVKTKTDRHELFQWIFNEADIDAARIVWARDLGTERNAELARYFTGRQMWLVNPNVEPATRAPYPPVNETGAPSDSSSAGIESRAH